MVLLDVPPVGYWSSVMQASWPCFYNHSWCPLGYCPCCPQSAFTLYTSHMWTIARSNWERPLSHFIWSHMLHLKTLIGCPSESGRNPQIFTGCWSTFPVTCTIFVCLFTYTITSKSRPRNSNKKFNKISFWSENLRKCHLNHVLAGWLMNLTSIYCMYTCNVLALILPTFHIFNRSFFSAKMYPK